MTDEQTELVNWLNEVPSEFRRTGDNEILAFIMPSDLSDLGKLLQALNDDYFTDGAMDMVFNGHDIVLDIEPFFLEFDINPKLIKELPKKV